MALPKLNTTPYYDVIIPSTGEKTRFRPYLVKEEKILLMASETADNQEIAGAMLNIVCECVEGVNRNKLTTFDMEYLFLQLRSKAVGETATMLATCQNGECFEENEVKVEIGKVEVNIPKDKNNIITLSDDMSIELKYPTYNAVLNNKIMATEESETELVYQTVLLCLDILNVKDERMQFAEEPIEDVVEFIGSLSTDQFRNLSEFATNIPSVEETVNFKCKKCNKESEWIIQGSNDFF